MLSMKICMLKKISLDFFSGLFLCYNTNVRQLEDNTMTNNEIVAKLWSMANVLRDDGISYQNYVTELTYLLFLKMMKEQGTESAIPEGYRWDDLLAKEGLQLKTFYKRLLLDLGNSEIAKDNRLNMIYDDASTSIDEPANLEKIIKDIDALDWYSANAEWMDNVYFNTPTSNGVWNIGKSGNIRYLQGLNSAGETYPIAIIGGRYMDIVGASVGGSTSTYYYDYQAISGSTGRVVYRSSYSASAGGGVACLVTSSDSSSASSGIGSRLAIKKRYWRTIPKTCLYNGAKRNEPQ